MTINEIINSNKLTKRDLTTLIKNGNKDKFLFIANRAKDPLSKQLALGHPKKFRTIIGLCGNLRNAIEYIVTPSYPDKLLSKSSLTSKNIDTIPKHKVRVKNYLSVMAVLVFDRINNDEELINLLKENDKLILPVFMSNVVSLGETHEVVKVSNTLTHYTYILRIYSTLIKNGMFDSTNVLNVVKALKMSDSESVYEDVHFETNTDY